MFSMQSLKASTITTHSGIVFLNIDHGLWFGSYGLMVDGKICNDSYGLWADQGLEAKARDL